MNATASTRRSGGFSTSPWFVLLLVCIAQFMVILDGTVVNVALPKIEAGLNFTSTSLLWIINAYTITFGGFLLLGGRAADLFGRRTVFLVGIVIFTASSFADGVSANSTMLIIARGFQGLGGALISPAALAIITTTFAEGDERTKALGVWSGIAAAGAAFGLILGGVLTQSVGWRWIFFVNVPVGIAAFILSSRYVPNTRVSGKRGVDIFGAITVTAGLMFVVYAITKVAPPDGWGSHDTIVYGLIGIALLVTFVIIELLHPAPIVRLGVFRVRSLTVSNVTMLLVASGMFAMFLFLTLFIQGILGYKPIPTGFAFLPFCFGIGVGAVAAQQLIKRIGVQIPTVIGLLVAAAGFLMLLRLDVGISYWTVLFPALVVMSIGMGLTFVPITLVATTNLDADDAGLASGLLNTSQQVGGALGLAILATLANNRAATTAGPPVAGVIAGYHLAFLWGALLLCAGAVVIVVFLRGHHVANIAGIGDPEVGDEVVA